MKNTTLTLAVAFLALSAPALAKKTPEPIIDVHLHAQKVADYGPLGKKFCTPHNEFAPFDAAAGKEWRAEWLGRNLDPECPKWVPQSTSDEALLGETLEIMERRNIIGVVSGSAEMTAIWKAASPDRIIASREFNLGRDAHLTPEILAAQFDDGGFDVLGEVTNQYAGFGPNAAEFDAYWALAEEKDFPVGIHMGTMPPGSTFLFGGTARISLGDPFLLEEVLARHPKLRVYMMHAGYPHEGRTIAMLRQYPQLYVDVGVLAVTMPRDEYRGFLERLVRAGMGKRIMFGSDQMIWPGIIEASIEAIESAKLSKKQKRDILYNNAARFLRFDEATIKRHHGED